MADDPSQAEEPETSGWDAIAATLRRAYGDREPLHLGTLLPYALGGRDPIHGISVYSNVTPTPHWHFVTYGFSELWGKETSDPEVSGYGFELTFRLTRAERDEKPPNWALNFLQNLGRYVFETGNSFGIGHTLPLNGPIELGSRTCIEAVSFFHDPELPLLITPNGRVEFLQIVGLTLDELEAISSWDAAAFLELRKADDSLLLTDLSRKSWLTDSVFAAEVSRRTSHEGSSCDYLALELQCDVTRDPACIRLQSIAVRDLGRRLLGRLPYGRALTLRGANATAEFRPGTKSGLAVEGGVVTITLRGDHLIDLTNTLQPCAGVYPVPGVDHLILQVLRTEIKGQNGSVVETVG